MSDEADALQLLHQLASAIEQQHGPCRVERALFLIWLEDMLRSGLATGADEEAVVAAIFRIYPAWQAGLGKFDYVREPLPGEPTEYDSDHHRALLAGDRCVLPCLADTRFPPARTGSEHGRARAGVARWFWKVSM